MTDSEFSFPVRSGFKADDKLHRRNQKAIEEFLENPNFNGATKIADATIGSAKIADAAITNAKIDTLSVDKLTGGTLQADVILGSTIATGPVDTQRVVITPGGIQGLDAANAVKVNISTAGEASFNGQLTASGLDVTGNATIRGTANVLERDSVSTLAAGGVTDPAVAPTVVWAWAETTISGSDSANTKRGLAWDATSSLWWVGLPSAYRFASITTAGVTTSYSSNGDPSLSELTGQPAILRQVYGVCRIGSDLKVVATNGDRIMLQTRPAASPGTLSDERKITGSFQNYPSGDRNSLGGVATDGTYLYVHYFHRSAGGVDTTRIVKLDADGVFISATTMSHDPNGAGSPTAVGLVVTGGKYWLQIADADTATVHVYVNVVAGTGSSSDDFDADPQAKGLGWDGTNFTSVKASALAKHSNWVSTSTTEHVAYAWYDNASTRETKASPETQVAQVDRAYLRVSVPELPTGADRVRVYVLENSSASVPAAGALKRQVTVAATSTDLDAYTAAGLGDLVASTLIVGGSPAELKTGAAGFRLLGDGTLILPKYTADPAGAEGRVYFNTTTKKARCHNGTTWNDLF